MQQSIRYYNLDPTIFSTPTAPLFLRDQVLVSICWYLICLLVFIGGTGVHIKQILYIKYIIVHNIKPRPVNEQMMQMPTQEEVLQAIKAMRNNKSPGLDGIPAEVFKNGGQRLTERLSKLFTLIWNTETIPQQFKDANIIPIYKNKGQRSSCDNYRGISLLSVAGKILARIVLRRIIDGISEEVLSESQCGFPFRSQHNWYDLLCTTDSGKVQRTGSAIVHDLHRPHKSLWHSQQGRTLATPQDIWLPWQNH